jgi:hypothetical protein
MDKLDGLVTDHLIERLFKSPCLVAILASGVRRGLRSRCSSGHSVASTTPHVLRRECRYHMPPFRRRKLD